MRAKSGRTKMARILAASWAGSSRSATIGLDLVIAAVESLSAAPTTAAGESDSLRCRFRHSSCCFRRSPEIGSVGDELAVGGEDGRECGFALLGEYSTWRTRTDAAISSRMRGMSLDDRDLEAKRHRPSIEIGSSHNYALSGWRLGRYTPRMRNRLKFLALLLMLPLFTAFASAQDWAKNRLEQSPRHREWVPLKHGDRTVQAYVVYPEVKGKAPVVVMIHEIFGLTDWAKEMADEIAAEGLYRRRARPAQRLWPEWRWIERLRQSGRYDQGCVRAESGCGQCRSGCGGRLRQASAAANGKLVVAGFCWGGGKSFLFATHRKDLSAAFVFYGPPPADVSGITAPVYGFYGGNDARISSTVPATIAAMKAARKKYEPVIYDGAGHGFMRAGEDPSPTTTPANRKAREEGFTRFTTC